MKKNQLTLAIGLASSTLLVGCFGDDSSTTTTETTSYSVKAIDGYLQGAEVWLDLNRNYQLDAGEPSATSQEGGVANLDVSGIEGNPEDYPVVVRAIAGTTIDEDNPGIAITTDYVMSAPAGETAVTPLSTMVNLVLTEKAAEEGIDLSDVTTNELEELKQKAVYEVAGEDLDPELVLSDYVEVAANADSGDADAQAAAEAAERIAYEAEIIVKSSQLPEEPAELAAEIEKLESNQESSLLKTLDAVSEATQSAIENLKAKEGVEDLDFGVVELPDFLEDVAVLDTDDEDNDIDGDGVLNIFDAFPDDATEWADSDGDGTGDNADTDDDNDGVDDSEDAFPLNPQESVDTDDDGIGNIADTDDDDDGVIDTEDAFPLDSTEILDTDGDGTGDNADTDIDGDGILNDDDPEPLVMDESADTDGDGLRNSIDDDDDDDSVLDDDDAFPLNAAESKDTDNDGIGDNADTDIDGDGIPNDIDAFELDKDESIDTDGDGTGNNEDADDDGDGIEDIRDYFPLDASETIDSDGDGRGDNADAFDDDRFEWSDDDGDGYGNNKDVFDTDDTEWYDFDEDGTGDNADTDDDNDGTADTDDAFPFDKTESLDTDGDKVGNNADTDDDNDGVADEDDDLPLNANESVDTDNDGIGNNEDTDDDGDGVADTEDTFPLDNTESEDSDGDKIGNNADADDDNDGVADENDDLPFDSNESVDTDGDGIGNNADTDDDNDNVLDGADDFPLDSAESVDTDGDGIGNNADEDDDGDGVNDGEDAFPEDASESADSDGDGYGDNEDAYPNDADRFQSDEALTAAINFINSQSELYDVWQEDNDNGLEEVWVETLTIENGRATLSAFQKLNAEGSLVDQGNNDDDDIVLTADGWESISGYYIDTANDKIIGYQGNQTELAYTGVATLTDLSGKVIAENAEFDSYMFSDTTATFPEGSQVLEIDYVPQQDMYTLWEDAEVQDYSNSTNGQNPQPIATLDALIALGSGFSGPAYRLGVELVEGDDSNTINYSVYNSDYSETLTTGSGEWTRETINGEDIISCRVPDDVITALGDSWDHDSPTIVYGVYNGQVLQGEFLTADADEDEDDTSAYYNAAAEEALLAVLEVQVDTDGDGAIDSIDNDDDNDGVEDEDDAFPLDGSESVDTDNDGIGNNADTDDDGDGVSDTDDAFPLDPTESSDRDGDNVGDNADAFPDDASKSQSDADVEAAKAFVTEASSLYEIWDEGVQGANAVYMDSLSVSAEVATYTGTQKLNSAGTMDPVANDDDEDLILTSTGWTQLSGYRLDASGATLIAYDGSGDDYAFDVTATLHDLNGEVISDVLDDAVSITNTTATFSSGAQALELAFTPKRDNYWLWDWNASISGQNWTDNVTSIDEIIVDTPAADDSMWYEVVALYLGGGGIAVELVDDFTANYYILEPEYFDDGSYSDIARKVASSTWSYVTGTQGTVYETIQFTLPQMAIDEFGDNWREDTATMIAGLYNGRVNMGQMESAGQVEDEDDNAFILNETAKNDILSASSVSCSTAVFDRENLSEGAFFERANAYQECSGEDFPEVTEDKINGLAIELFTSDGLRREYIFGEYSDEFGTRNRVAYIKAYEDREPRESDNDWEVNNWDEVTYFTRGDQRVVLLEENDDELVVAWYYPEETDESGNVLETSSSSVRTFTDISFTSEDLFIDDSTQEYVSLEEYVANADASRSQQGTTATFNASTLAGTTWEIRDVEEFYGTRAARLETRLVFNANGTVSYTESPGLGLLEETFTANWSVDDNGRLVLGDGSVGETFTIIDTEGTGDEQLLSVRAYWSGDEGDPSDMWTSIMQKKTD